MRRHISIALLVGGIALVICGIAAAEALSSNIARLFADHPGYPSSWCLVGGIAAIVAGAFGLRGGSRAT